MARRREVPQPQDLIAPIAGPAPARPSASTGEPVDHRAVKIIQAGEHRSYNVMLMVPGKLDALMGCLVDNGKRCNGGKDTIWDGSDGEVYYSLEVGAVMLARRVMSKKGVK